MTMKKNVLISLVSDQTIPNVELIEEFKENTDKYIFIHSKKTETHLSWITDATGIQKFEKIEIDPFSINDIETKLRSHNFDDDNYILNITGGTKIMILVLMEFFKNLGATIFYVVGKDLKYIKVFPLIGKREYTLKKKLTLDEYLKSYGFKIVKASSPIKSFHQANKIFRHFIKNDFDTFNEIIELIRNRRGKKLNLTNQENIKKFLKSIDFIPEKPDILNEKETKYLTGEWFEEYIYFKIKDELIINDNEIGLGYNVLNQNTPNEFDVLFMVNHKLYIIECKTSIFDLRISGLSEETENNNYESKNITKKYNLLPEIIYKADALKSKLGLFANILIFTLEEIKNEDHEPKDEHKVHFDRALLSHVGIVSKRDFKENKKIDELIQLK